MLESWFWGQQRTDWQANPTMAQAWFQGYDLACPNIHSIYDLLEHVKGPDLQAQNCKISITQANNRISQEEF